MTIDIVSSGLLNYALIEYSTCLFRLRNANFSHAELVSICIQQPQIFSQAH